eukprot:11253781-Karenia_brevis.AAC.1
MWRLVTILRKSRVRRYFKSNKSRNPNPLASTDVKNVKTGQHRPKMEPSGPKIGGLGRFGGGLVAPREEFRRV